MNLAHFENSHAAAPTLDGTALGDAARGLRRLLTLNPAGTSPSVAVLPLPAQDSAFDTDAAPEPLVMLVLGKQSANQALPLDFFARTHKHAFREAAHARVGADIAAMLEQDLHAVQDRGFDRLGDDRERPRQRYAAVARPMAAEVVH
jgi:hypothetical protein